MAPPLIAVPIFFPPVTWQTQTHTKADASAGIYKHPNSYYLKSSFFLSLFSAAYGREELAQGHDQSGMTFAFKNDQSGMTFAFYLQPTILLARLGLSALSRIREPGPGE